jgi:hypothetical protein
METRTASLQRGPAQNLPPTKRTFLNLGPICCKRKMKDLVRRVILRGDGSIVYCCVWHCLNCGRLLL